MIELDVEELSLIYRIKQGFDEKTCHPDYEFNPDCPESGQCAAFVLAAQTLFPEVTIWKGFVKRRRHYIGKIGDFWFDYTAEQFGLESVTSISIPYSGAWSVCHISDPDTRRRAALLVDRAAFKPADSESQG